MPGCDLRNTNNQDTVLQNIFGLQAVKRSVASCKLIWPGIWLNCKIHAKWQKNITSVIKCTQGEINDVLWEGENVREHTVLTSVAGSTLIYLYEDSLKTSISFSVETFPTMSLFAS